MNLDKAYESWGQMSDNRELYFKTKTLFRKMWWLIPTNKPCSYYTLEVLGRALVQANGAQSDKVKAASVMVHVLNFAHTAQPDDNPKPAFGFQEIVDYTGDKPSPMVQAIETIEAEANQAQAPIHLTGTGALKSPEVKVKPAAKAKRMAELAKRDGGKAAEKAAKAAIKREKNDAGIGSSEREQARRDNGKAVVQLDPDTLKPVKVWPSCFAAQKELGIKNVQRAISRCGKSGGYYWCRPGDEESFKPMDKRANNRVPKKTDTNKPKPPTKEQKELYRKVFDDARGGIERQPTPEQQEQLKEAEVAVAKARQELEITSLAEQTREDALPGTYPLSSLQHCTQDELIAELRRRQWKGILHITQTIEL